MSRSPSLQELEELLDVPYVFTQRPRPFPVDLQLTWRLPLIVLLVDYCRGKQASIEQLHVLHWAVRSPVASNLLKEAIERSLPPDRVLVRYEPTLPKVIDIAIGEQLLDWTKKARVQLTSKGMDLLEEARASGVFQAEQKTLGVLGRKITQVDVERLLQRDSLS